MKLLKLSRFRDDGTQTLGYLTNPNTKEFFGYSLERPWLNNHANVSCIPPGFYKMDIINRASNGDLVYYLLDTYPRTEILIHPGNTVKDIEGCILVGESIFGKAWIGASRLTLNELLSEEFDAIDIDDDFCNYETGVHPNV